MSKQATQPDALLPALDLRQTDLFACRVAESVAGCVPRPIVAGGRPLQEITVELQPAWDPAKLEDIEAADTVFGADGAPPDSTYGQRYCTDGAVHAAYADVGRLWDANTDGRYSGEPWSLSETDVALLADFDADYWPLMPHKPLPMLTRAGGADSGSAGAVVEWTIDGGTTWYPLAGARVGPDRLAVRLTMKDLTALSPPTTVGSRDPVGGNFFQQLIDAPAQVKVRLTCSIADPARAIVIPERRATAGSAFDQAAWFDRGVLGQTRSRAATSLYSGSTARVADVTDAHNGLSRLEDEAAQIQAAVDDRLLEASLPIEWPDAELHLTDVVERILGIDYPLAANAGAARIYPRIVGREILLTDLSWAMALALDTDRWMGRT